MPRPRREYDDDYEDEDEEDYDRPVRRRGRRRPPDIGDDPGMRLLLPVGRSGWAIAAGYLGLFSVLCLPAPLALFCGVMAVREMRRNPKAHGMGRAVFGIVMGGLGTLATVAMIVAAVINPK